MFTLALHLCNQNGFERSSPFWEATCRPPDFWTCLFRSITGLRLCAPNIDFAYEVLSSFSRFLNKISNILSILFRWCFVLSKAVLYQGEASWPMFSAKWTNTVLAGSLNSACFHCDCRIALACFVYLPIRLHSYVMRRILREAFLSQETGTIPLSLKSIIFH